LNEASLPTCPGPSTQVGVAKADHAGEAPGRPAARKRRQRAAYNPKSVNCCPGCCPATLTTFALGEKCRFKLLISLAPRAGFEPATQRLTEKSQPFRVQFGATRCAILGTGEHSVRPFHWTIEFPEVFAHQDPGFDAVVGNPPFAGKNTIIATFRRKIPAFEWTGQPCGQQRAPPAGRRDGVRPN